MSFEVFRNRVNALIERSGGNLMVAFSSEGGKHTARISDGTTIIGNLTSHKVSVRWGSGHTAQAAI